jgi:hypothetical protein
MTNTKYEEYEQYRERKYLDLIDGFFDKFRDLEQKFEEYCWDRYEKDKQ